MNTSDPLPSGELHVWFVDLTPAASPFEEGERLLSAEERSRADRFVFPRDRRRYVTAHVALREVLGRYLGRSGGDIRFTAGPQGKPSVESVSDKWLRFNLAHSHEGALIACARGIEVGIDIEWIRENVDADMIVASSFSADERAEWATTNPEERESAFFAGWVRKEAYVKALGEGLSHLTSAYTVRLAPAGQPALLNDVLRPATESLWWLHNVEVPAGYVAAAAAPSPLKVITRTWESSSDSDGSIRDGIRPGATPGSNVAEKTGS
jgi:4'-phosphopantetheinyl transferase